MQISKLALFAGMFAGTNIMGSQKIAESNPIGNRSLPSHIQNQLIAAAKIKRQRQANTRFMHGLTRDARYYRVSLNSNKNRFVPMNRLEEMNHAG